MKADSKHTRITDLYRISGYVRVMFFREFYPKTVY